MRSLFVTLFFVAIVCSSGGLGKSQGQFCRYWCRTTDNRYYCCPSGKTETWMEYAWHNIFYPLLWITVDESLSFDAPWSETLVEKKKEIEKHCPPLRTHCPRNYDMPPISCHKDEDCGEWEKCCYDVCLEHKTCKPVEL